MRCVAFVALVALAGAAEADYKAYVRGQEAAVESNWTEVETEMQAALAGNPKAQVRVRLYGQRFAPYVPQYYLGLAAYRQNDCNGALRWFGNAAAAAVIEQISEFKGVADAARRDCTAKLAATAKPVVPPTVAEVVPPPVAVIPTTKPTTATTPTTKPPPPQPPIVKPVVTTTTPVTPAASTVPAALQSALQNWLSGKYRGVVGGSTTGVQGRALAHLHLLRAAAYHALAETEAGGAAAHRASAEQEARLARRALASIAPDPGYFSPRFRQFFSAVR